jgi:hypothetical protein
MNSTDTLASNTAAVGLCNRLHHSANDNLCSQLHGPLRDRVAFYADAARSLATRRAYASDMAAFLAWGGRVPASPEAVASYLAASDSLAAATLRRRRAAIADAHQALGHPDPPDSWVITIQRSKTDPYGRGQYIPLPAFRGPLCPAAAMADWLAIAAIAEGPIFRAVGSTGNIRPTLPAPQVGSILRRRAADAGLHVHKLSAHSLRSGFAVSATRAGIAAAQIQAVTRHRTVGGFAPYVRTAGPPSVAQLLALPAFNASTSGQP